MNYYIDFDHTLFDTKKLTNEMLETIAKYINESSQIEYEECLKEVISIFNRDNIHDIYKLIRYNSNKYNLNEIEVTNKVNNAILNCSKYVFEDTEPFLQKLKNEENKLYLLTYFEGELQYQLLKIYGSGLASYFNGIFSTNTKKYDLDLIYENGIFIDDNPKELNGFYLKNAREVIRIRRPNDTYSNKETDNVNIKEYASLAEIKIE